jgi:hypothetical protein
MEGLEVCGSANLYGISSPRILVHPAQPEPNILVEIGSSFLRKELIG